MRILVAPVLVGDRICRIVSPIDSVLEVEEWMGEWWEPSSVTLTTASQAESAPERLLEARGVPADDRIATEPRPSDPDIQALLRALEPMLVKVGRIEESASGPPKGARRREYSGNARFRRARAITPSSALDRPDLRRAGTSDEWKGPRRRATDVPPPDAPRGPTN